MVRTPLMVPSKLIPVLTGQDRRTGAWSDEAISAASEWNGVKYPDKF